jgi:uncharacterized protein (DUF362 family)
MSSIVAIVDANELTVDDAMARAIDLIGGISIANDSRIVVKPNLTSDKRPADAGGTTRVEVVEAFVKYANRIAQDCEIMIVESDSDGTAARAFQRLGYSELESHHGNVKLVDLSREKTVKLLLDGTKVRSIEVPQILLETDYYVSVANLKRHVNERMSGIWKNNWGLPSNHLARIRMHPFLSEVLYDFNSVFWPDLSIIDAITGLEGPGPLDGYPVRVEKLICGRDPLAVDSAAARLIGESPKRIPHLHYALKKLRRNPNDLRIVGSGLQPLQFKFIPEYAYWFGRFGLFLRKIGLYVENLGYLVSIGGYAFRLGKPTDFLGGRMQSIAGTLKVARDLVIRVDVADKYYG